MDKPIKLHKRPNGWGIRCGGVALVLICSTTVFYTADTCMPLLGVDASLPAPAVETTCFKSWPEMAALAEYNNN
jgi:hypothetical protein